MENEINFDRNTDKQWLKKLSDYCDEFYLELPNKNAYSDLEATDIDYILSPENKCTFDDILRFTSEHLNSSGIQAGSGKHFGFIPGGGLYENALGDFIAAIGNYYSGVSYAAPVAVKLENTVINWVAKELGFSSKTKGSITSGGSIANLTGLVVAKKTQGIVAKNIEKHTIYLSTHSHHSIHKALDITGLSEAVIRCIPLNGNFEMDLDVLSDHLKKDTENGLIPSIVISSAGTTNVGAIDDLSKINTLAKRYNAWHHIDAAYGGFFALCPKGKNLLEGINLADSITLDPHKGLFQSYGSGIVLINNGDYLAKTFTSNADYMRDVNNMDWSPSDLSIELSRPFRALSLWMSLKLHGVDAFRAALEEKLYLAEFAYSKLCEYGYILDPKPKLSIVLFKKHNNEETKKLFKAIITTSGVFVSSTEIDTTIWIRIAILSHRSTIVEVNELLEFLRTWNV